MLPLILVHYMKKLLSLLFLFSFGIKAFSQNSQAILEVNYETKIIPDSTNRNNVKVYTSTLLCNLTESSYFSREAQAFFNGTSTENIPSTLGNIPKYPKSVESAYRFNDQLTASLPVGKYIFTFEEPKLKWKILSDTKNIKDFQCRLAQTTTDTGDIFFAWFTNDIAIPEGPFRFKGLSGLVLEVYNLSKTIEIHATEIKKSDEIIKPLNYGDNLVIKDKKQYLTARKNYHENPSIYNGNIKVFDANGNDKTKIMTDRLKHINVFLD